MKDRSTRSVGPVSSSRSDRDDEDIAATGRGTVAAVFLDRDGTISEEVGYINHLDRLRIYPWTADAIRRLNQAGLPVIAITNQSGVGRGYFTETLVRQAHRKIASQLAAAGARVDAFYYCPHHPSAPVEAYRVDCRCRKPAPGMVEKAARRFHIDLKDSYVVGDSYRDMQLGFNIGARTALVMTGYGRGEYEYHRHKWPRMPDLIAENLLEVVKQILAEPAGPRRTRIRRSRARRTL
ncbi:MAG: HAD family hydrolase [Acidobacteria bacterium]|nr:HAD family hydrolase [Acidobacteriota bacterium]